MGKTTIINLISKLLPVKDNTILYNGVDINKISNIEYFNNIIHVD